jgi:hypothetical protein
MRRVRSDNCDPDLAKPIDPASHGFAALNRTHPFRRASHDQITCFQPMGLESTLPGVIFSCRRVNRVALHRA